MTYHEKELDVCFWCGNDPCTCAEDSFFDGYPEDDYDYDVEEWWEDRY